MDWKYIKYVLWKNICNERGDILTGLISYWSFSGSGSCTTVPDSSGNNNTGTVTGTLTYASGPFASVNSVSFDGGTTYIGGANVINSSAITVSAWVNLPSELSNIPILWFQNGFNSNTNDKGLTVNGINVIFNYYNGASNCMNSGASGVALNSWHMITCTVTSGGVGGIMYIDGINVGSNSATDTYTGYTVPNLFLGAPETTNPGCSRAVINVPSGGMMAEARVYNRALSPTDVTELYNFTGASTFISRLTLLGVG